MIDINLKALNNDDLNKFVTEKLNGLFYKNYTIEDLCILSNNKIFVDILHEDNTKEHFSLVLPCEESEDYDSEYPDNYYIEEDVCQKLTDEEFRELLKHKQINYVDVKQGWGRYERMTTAATYFQSYDEADNFAKYVNGVIVKLHNRGEYWENYGDVYEEIDMMEVYNRDLYMVYEKMTEEEFIDLEIKNYIEYLDSVEEMQSALEYYSKIWNAIDKMKDDEVVVSNIENRCFEVKPRYNMGYDDLFEDYYIIGVIV